MPDRAGAGAEGSARGQLRPSSPESRWPRTGSLERGPRIAGRPRLAQAKLGNLLAANPPIERGNLDHQPIGLAGVGRLVDERSQGHRRFGGQQFTGVEPKDPIAGQQIEATVARGGEVVAPSRFGKGYAEFPSDGCRPVG